MLPSPSVLDLPKEIDQLVRHGDSYPLVLTIESTGE